MGAVLRFPSQVRLGQHTEIAPADKKVAKLPRFWSEMQSLDSEGASRLLDVTKDIILKVQSLVSYVDHNRKEARSSGVETIAIELASILEGGKLIGVQDALEDAAEKGSRPMITLDGFSKLRRAQLLISEADQAAAMYVENPTAMHANLGHAGHSSCNLCSMSGGAGLSSIGNIPVSMLVLGVIGAGAIFAVVIMALTKK